MTAKQKQLIRLMNEGNCYIVSTKNRRKRPGFVVYKGIQEPLLWIPQRVAWNLTHLMKNDKRGGKYGLSLNLSKVRRLHGKSFIKQVYKKKRDKMAAGDPIDVNGFVLESIKTLIEPDTWGIPEPGKLF